MMRRLVIYVYDIRRLPSCTVYLLFKQVFSQKSYRTGFRERLLSSMVRSGTARRTRGGRNAGRPRQHRLDDRMPKFFLYRRDRERPYPIYSIKPSWEKLAMYLFTFGPGLFIGSDVRHAPHRSAHTSRWRDSI